jgi:hypothetical protein
VCLGKNDWEVFTGSPLYFQEGEFFSDDEFVTADSAFEGDGEVKKLWNLAFLR